MQARETSSPPGGYFQNFLAACQARIGMTRRTAAEDGKAAQLRCTIQMEQEQRLAESERKREHAQHALANPTPAEEKERLQTERAEIAAAKQQVMLDAKRAKQQAVAAAAAAEAQELLAAGQARDVALAVAAAAAAAADRDREYAQAVANEQDRRKALAEKEEEEKALPRWTRTPNARWESPRRVRRSSRRRLIARRRAKTSSCLRATGTVRSKKKNKMPRRPQLPTTANATVTATVWSRAVNQTGSFGHSLQGTDACAPSLLGVRPRPAARKRARPKKTTAANSSKTS